MTSTEISVGTPLTFSIDVQPVNSVAVSATPSTPVIIVPVPGIPGDEGPPGPPGDGTQVFNEIPGGDLNGSNTVFTLDNPYQAGTTVVYRNGIRQRLNSGYTETSSTQITFDEPPDADTEIIVDYLLR